MNEKTTSLEEFEKNLKANMRDGTTSLTSFEQQLKSGLQMSPKETHGINPNTSPIGEQIQSNKQQVRVTKNIVIAFPLSLVA